MKDLVPWASGELLIIRLQPRLLGTLIEILKCQSKGSRAAALCHTWSGMHMGLAKAEALDYYILSRLQLSIAVVLAA